jgi:hypothetical protein
MLFDMARWRVTLSAVASALSYSRVSEMAERCFTQTSVSQSGPLLDRMSTQLTLAIAMRQMSGRKRVARREGE